MDSGKSQPLSATAGKTITCRAAVLWKVKQPMVIEQVEVQSPRAGEVRLKVLYTAMCHTDYSVVEGIWEGLLNLPVILGHEGACVVESVGEGVDHVAVGDHVIPLYAPQCKACPWCLSPKTNVCPVIHEKQMQGVMPDGTTRFSCRGKQIYHYMGTSTFSEFTVVAGISVCRINPAAPMDKACLLGCSIPTGYGAVLNTCAVEAGSTVAVWGLGAVGLAVIMGAKEVGAREIIAIDLVEEKFKLAREFGATRCLNPRKDVPEGKTLEAYLAEQYLGGLDYTFECVGNVNTMYQALMSAKPGGGIACIIGAAPGGQKLAFEPLQLILGRTLKGSAFGGWKSRDSVPQLVERYMQGKIQVDPYITHRFKLTEINEAGKVLQAGKSIRSVISVAAE